MRTSTWTWRSRQTTRRRQTIPWMLSTRHLEDVKEEANDSADAKEQVDKPVDAKE